MMINMPTVRKGDTGQAVAALQEALIASGVPWVKVTGRFDDRTESCVLAYQKQYKLDADGIVGPKTWEALFS